VTGRAALATIRKQGREWMLAVWTWATRGRPL